MEIIILITLSLLVPILIIAKVLSGEKGAKGSDDKISGVLERAYFPKVKDPIMSWRLEGQMKIRLENGRIVDARYTKQLWFGSFFDALSRGDKVQVTGNWDGNIFRAHSIYNIQTGEQY